MKLKESASAGSLEMGEYNPGYEGERIPPGKYNNNAPPPSYGSVKVAAQPDDSGIGEKSDAPSRDQWGNPIEFLLSCIAMSVGLGNVWRFPSTAYENGGGAFLIPYLIVLLLIGKPLYFLEMALGQFSSFGSVKVWNVVPIVKGIGYGQALATWFVVTYYCVLMALTVHYFFASFAAVLPWTICNPDWELKNISCYSTLSNVTNNETIGARSASEIYFNVEVLNKWDNIDNGIGSPEWKLTLCLLFSWICIFLILMKGVSSSGKVAYFTALFPYVVLFILLIRGVTLEGASTGILYFITPQWGRLLDPGVWFAAVTQCFFSLSVSFGPIIMYSSYNPFKHRIYRDAMIISFADTATSLLASFTVFSILGNVAHTSNKNMSDVVVGGTGLAFISYPEAIGKFDVVPQLFAVLFFLMLFTLGVGSAVSLTGCVITIICDQFPHWKRWIVTAIVSSAGFLLGLVYVTPGGQYVLNIVDFFGGGFIIYVMAIIEIVAISWVYGVDNIIRDIKFMTGVSLGIYWKFTWAVFIPISLSVIFVYSLIQYKPIDEKQSETYTYVYPTSAMIAGWMVALVAIIQVPIWGAWVVYKQKRGHTFMEKLKNSFQFTDQWGPKDPQLHREWLQFRENNPLPESLYSKIKRLLVKRN